MTITISAGDRIRVKTRSDKLVGWEGTIIYKNNARYGIKFDKTPSITVFLNHDFVEKI